MSVVKSGWLRRFENKKGWGRRFPGNWDKTDVETGTGREQGKNLVRSKGEGLTRRSRIQAGIVEASSGQVLRARNLANGQILATREGVLATFEAPAWLQMRVWKSRPAVKTCRVVAVRRVMMWRRMSAAAPIRLGFNTHSLIAVWETRKDGVGACGERSTNCSRDDRRQNGQAASPWRGWSGDGRKKMAPCSAAEAKRRARHRVDPGHPARRARAILHAGSDARLWRGCLPVD